ncbi:MAG: alpha-xylosidase [Bifidobacteriaceae bacterium]|jgi:alpha-D-xyloside xylohydrolase|nr:alpha-xylosidase [Bifidobacteriaceae bacterium]
MRFSDGYWKVREGFSVLHPREVRDIRADPEAGTLTVYAPTARIRSRGDTLNRPLITVTLGSPAPGVISVRVSHHEGKAVSPLGFELAASPGYRPLIEIGEATACLRAGGLEARVHRGDGWRIEFWDQGRMLTSSVGNSVGLATADDGAVYVHEQLTLDVGESVYGLGERFGPVVKNGQSVDIWNEDGGTCSEQAYKNVPFYLTSKGYGVLVNDPGRVSFEVASEMVERVQFSVAGEALEYCVVAGPTPKDVLRRYTGLTGRPARVPAWSFGLWLSTSFSTSYDEATVCSFVDGMADRGLPLSVFHFDCFWMREFHWTDFEWDPEQFPEPTEMLARLKARGLQICVWINPYIAQRSRLFEEGRANGYFLRRADGSVWQCDSWQAGMAVVDFTNPAAAEWYAAHLRQLLAQGVDCFKTDFGERIPVEAIRYHDGSDPERMHNYYALIYNRTVFKVLEEVRGKAEAVVFARSATAGGQQFPVHWSGDNDSSYPSMAETLRGGLSLGLCGFGFWSHDIGGFEGTPDPTLFKRWLPFGLLSSHSRLHGSTSVRVPWAFDEEAVGITRRYAELKHKLMPYLARIAEEAHTDGLPVLRHLLLEFPDDLTARHVETQYMLGDSVLVAPVMRGDGQVDVYVPEGVWTSLLDGSKVTGPRWVRQVHPHDSLPVLVRPGTVLPLGRGGQRPDYDWAEGVTLMVFDLPDGESRELPIPSATGGPAAQFTVCRDGQSLVATGPKSVAWRLAAGDRTVEAANGTATLRVSDS